MFNKKFFFINKVSIKKINFNRCIIRIEPFYNTFCDTLGNFLRRTLFITSFCFKISHIKIFNVNSIYSNIKGISETTDEIINNIKNVVIKLKNDFFANLLIKKVGPCIVKARDIYSDKKTIILNPEKIIANINIDVFFFIIMKCIHSSFFKIIDKNFEKKFFQSKIFFLKNNDFSIKNIIYFIHKSSINNKIKKLFLDLETNGSISPDQCFKDSIFFVKKYFDIFFNLIGFEKKKIEKKNKKKIKINPLFLRSIDNLELNVRSSNCLKTNNIFLIGDLLKKKENDLKKIPNFGDRCLDNVKRMLSQKGLSLNMKINYEI